MYIQFMSNMGLTGWYMQTELFKACMHSDVAVKQRQQLGIIALHTWHCMFTCSSCHERPIRAEAERPDCMALPLHIFNCECKVTLR